MTVQTQNQNSPDIWKWKNTAHIAKTTMEFGFAVAAVATAATVIYAAAKGIALSSALPAFLANPWVIAAIVSYVAIYFVARSISSYQQLYSMEGAKGKDGTNGKDGVSGKDADFSVLLGDAIKDAKIVEKEVTKDGQKAEELCLELGSNREALLGKENNKDLYVIFKDENGEYTSKTLRYEVKDSNVVVTSVGDTAVNDLAAVKKELGVDEKTDLSAVAVSNQYHEALKDDVSAKLADVAIEGAIKKSTAKAA